MGGDGLALGVVPQRGQVLAQVSVVGPQGNGVSGLDVHVNGAAASECGSGCYRTTLAGTPANVVVRVRSTTWRVALPAAWPPRDARALLERAGQAWRSLHSLSFHERLASDSTSNSSAVSFSGEEITYWPLAHLPRSMVRHRSLQKGNSGSAFLTGFLQIGQRRLGDLGIGLIGMISQKSVRR
jgi:hypothetical protein